jgi:hypothetical protein
MNAVTSLAFELMNFSWKQHSSLLVLSIGEEERKFYNFDFRTASIQSQKGRGFSFNARIPNNDVQSWKNLKIYYFLCLAYLVYVATQLIQMTDSSPVLNRVVIFPLI